MAVDIRRHLLFRSIINRRLSLAFLVVFALVYLAGYYNLDTSQALAAPTRFSGSLAGSTRQRAAPTRLDSRWLP